MKRSTIEIKLNSALQRYVEAEREESYLDGQVRYHDAEASRLRKKRQPSRNKMERAKVAIARLNQLLLDTPC